MRRPGTLVLAGVLAFMVVAAQPAAGRTAARTEDRPVSSSAVAPAIGPITCTPTVGLPRRSGGTADAVRVVVQVSCTKNVAQIQLRAALYRDGKLVRDSGVKTVNDAAKAKNVATVTCLPATYRGWIGYTVAFPPGYQPPTASSSGFGDTKVISC